MHVDTHYDTTAGLNFYTPLMNGYKNHCSQAYICGLLPVALHECHLPRQKDMHNLQLLHPVTNIAIAIYKTFYQILNVPQDIIILISPLDTIRSM